MPGVGLEPTRALAQRFLSSKMPRKAPGLRGTRGRRTPHSAMERRNVAGGAFPLPRTVRTTVPAQLRHKSLLNGVSSQAVHGGKLTGPLSLHPVGGLSSLVSDGHDHEVSTTQRVLCRAR